MESKPPTPPATDLSLSTATRALHADVRRLLKKHNSPYELHQVRARFMGAIASAIVDVNPMNEVKALFGGELPELKNFNEANEIIQVFAMGLWNKLTHGSQAEPAFELTPLGVVKNSEQLKHFALVRSQEIESFVEGYFQEQDSIKLPMDVGNSFDVLEELVSVFAGIVAMPKDPKETEQLIAQTMVHLQNITVVIQTEMDTIIISSANARQIGGDVSSGTLH